ncbi:MAG: DUF4492 domain-containing protein [Desulfobacteraceae bacterium]|nr:DUF4492 domain-containing protein [Desulfobacteraceae bacterium]
MGRCLVRIAALYRDGFREMRLGRRLWKVILIKLVVIYLLGRLFFPDYLRVNFANDKARADSVLAALTHPDR